MEAAWNAMVVALVPILATFAVWLLKRLIDLAVSKIGCLTAETRQRIIKRVTDLADLAARQTAQTYVDALKEASKDGKLTDEEKAEALKRAKELLMTLLKDQGLEVGRVVGSELLTAALESAVRWVSASRAAKLANAAGN